MRPADRVASAACRPYMRFRTCQPAGRITSTSTTRRIPTRATSSGSGARETTTVTASRCGGWTPASRRCIRTHPARHRATTSAAGGEVGNIYPLLHEIGHYRGHAGRGRDRDRHAVPVGVGRQPAYGAAVWSGDISSTFEALLASRCARAEHRAERRPVVDDRHRRLPGRQYRAAVFRELIVRWFQYGTFWPLFRLHGIVAPAEGDARKHNEVWSFGDEAYGIIRKYMFIRERLRPYIMEQMQLASEAGVLSMRPAASSISRRTTTKQRSMTRTCSGRTCSWRR